MHGRVEEWVPGFARVAATVSKLLLPSKCVLQLRRICRRPWLPALRGRHSLAQQSAEQRAPTTQHSSSLRRRRSRVCRLLLGEGSCAAAGCTHHCSGGPAAAAAAAPAVGNRLWGTPCQWLVKQTVLGCDCVVNGCGVSPVGLDAECAVNWAVQACPSGNVGCQLYKVSLC